jgi:excinuclease UvrABC ATPase subunit
LTLREVLSLPVEDLAAAQSLLGTSIERHLNLLCRVELGRYSLGVDISNVPVTAVVQATVASALSKSEEGQLLIIDTPLSALPDAQRSSLISLIEQHAVTASIVVISGDDADTTAPAVKQSSSASNTPWITVPHPDTGKLLDVGPGLRLTVTRRASEPARWLAGVQRQLDEAPSVGSLQPRAFTPTFIPLFPRHEMRRLTLAEELEIYERLSRLFASSQDAKMLGLAPASFRLGSHSNKKLVCPACRGLGLELTRAPGFTRPVPAPCSGCRGARFTRALREITFRGSRMSDLLNRPLKESAHTLKVLPKAGRMLELLTALGLDHLPLGFPIALLSPAEFRLVCIAKAVASARSERPALLLLEHPWAGFSAEQRQRLVAVLETEPATNLSWILEL